MRKIGFCILPITLFIGFQILLYSMSVSMMASGDLIPLMMFASIPEWAGGPSIPIEFLIAIYFVHDSAVSQHVTSIIWAAILVIMSGVVTFIVIAIIDRRKSEAERLEMKTKLREIKTKKLEREPPLVREETKKEIVYTRCRYCGAKVPETETKCPECGAKL